MQSASRSLNVLYVVVLICWAWSALQPSHANWGFHFFAFYPPWVGIVCLGILLLETVPRVRRGTVAGCQRFIHWCSRHAKRTSLVVLSGVLVLLMYLFPSKLHLLGDGDIILQLTPKDPAVKDVSANFQDQPLIYYTVREAQLLIGGGSPVDVVDAYRLIDLVTGVCFLILVLVFLNQLSIPAVEKVLLGCLLFITPRLQFHFGYVENYALPSLFIAAYMVTGWLTLRDRLHSIVAFLFFTLSCGVHLGSLVLFPSLLVIAHHGLRRSRMEVIVSGVVAVAVGLAIYVYSHFSFDRIWDRIGSVYHNELLPVSGWHYSIFSFFHFLDWINAVGLIAPFSIIGGILLLLPLLRMGTLRWNDELLIFLLLSSACTLALTLIVSPALGMARDWDLMAVFFIPPSFLFLYLLLCSLSFVKVRQLVISIVLLQAIQVASWIGINADETRHLNRAELLTDPSLIGTIPKMYYESLGRIFWERHDLRSSLKWYERYLTIDSTNPRILANLSDLYRQLGQSDKSFGVLRRSAGASRDPSVYSNLGVEYLRHGDTASAIRMFTNALSINTTFPTAHANLAIVYAMQKKDSLVITHALQAFAGGFDEPYLHKITGDAYVEVGDFARAVINYDLYLARKPGDTRTTAVRDRIKRLLAK